MKIKNKKSKIITVCRECFKTFNEKKEFCNKCYSANLISNNEIENLNIAHVDCDAFYAAIEKRDNPKYKNFPIIIGGGKRGVVATACYIARTRGVKSAMPMYRALKLCPDAIIIKPNMQKYKKASKVINNLMKEITPLVEPLSLDEAFLDLSGTSRLHKKIPAVLLAELSKKIQKKVGISVSIGLSYNKFLAKICSDIDKPRGFSIINRLEAQSFLKDKPVEVIWGVGNTLKSKLNNDGIRTIGQIREMDCSELIIKYGSIGSHIHKLSNAEDVREIKPYRKVKSISHETTFEKDTNDEVFLKKILWSLCEKVSDRAKEKGLGGSTINLKIKTKDFKLISRSITIEEPTQIAEIIFQTSKLLLFREIKKNKFRLLGVGLSNLKDSEICDLYDLINTNSNKEKNIEFAIDAIRNRYGVNLIKKGRSI
jgi:DNA polymerase-4|tara:strand:- start:17006 stop:18283 length:1278 start_codon:yes stop_codon:yes gene_type:complete